MLSVMADSCKTTELICSAQFVWWLRVANAFAELSTAARYREGWIYLHVHHSTAAGPH